MVADSIIARSLRKMGIDRAVGFGTLYRGWSAVCGALTIILIAACFSKELQGYYYTFNSLLALTVFIELGLGMVIQQFASHEWSQLRLNEKGFIEGDPNALSRLASLAQVSFRWYGLASICAAVGIGITGAVLFSQKVHTHVHWTGPWVVLCCFCGVNLLLLPAWSLLEGSNQIQHTYRMRLIVGVSSAACSWLVILLGGGLWAATTLTATMVLIAATLILKAYLNYFKSLFAPVTGPKIHWLGEVWPMQRRVAISWMSGYFIFWFFTPVLFHYKGAVAAGQMGMTLLLVSANVTISSTWVAAKAPVFGMLVAGKKFAELDKLYSRATVQTAIVGTLGAGAIWLGLALLHVTHHALAGRFVGLLPAGIFLLTSVMNTIIISSAIYLRAHKREPYAVIALVQGLVVACSTLLLGSRYGAIGMGVGYLFCTLIFLVPYMVVFRRCRAAWHAGADEDVTQAVSEEELPTPDPAGAYMG